MGRSYEYNAGFRGEGGAEGERRASRSAEQADELLRSLELDSDDPLYRSVRGELLLGASLTDIQRDMSERASEEEVPAMRERYEAVAAWAETAEEVM